MVRIVILGQARLPVIMMVQTNIALIEDNVIYQGSITHWLHQSKLVKVQQQAQAQP